MSEAPSPPAIRPASTLVLVRGDARPQILLLLRHAQHGFMPNMWVFPGGRVEAADGLGAIDGAGGDADDMGARRAAVRETWEEAGILLQTPVRTAGPEEVRDASAIGAALWPMACFARWVTPVGERRRFDTRFYLAQIPDAIDAVPDQGEVIEALWISPDDALTRHRAGTLALAPPTFWAIEALRRLTTGEAISAWAEATERVGVSTLEPKLVLEGGTAVVSVAPELLPLPGEPVSGRLRLVRGVWHEA